MAVGGACEVLIYCYYHLFSDTGGFDVKMTSSFVGMNLKSVTVNIFYNAI